METIKIDETVQHLVFEEFKNLPDVDYKLTKVKNFRIGFVFSGDTVTGPLRIVNVTDLPGVRVDSNRGFDITYIRTSPIVAVVDVTLTTLTFETEGGVYKLERVKND